MKTIHYYEAAGYGYTYEIDHNKPDVWLEGNTYKFNKVLVKREPLKNWSPDKLKCLYIKV